MQLAIKNQPVCFAHGGFAVAGASNESQVHLWDAERGDRLLSLDHGGSCHELGSEEDHTKKHRRGFESTHGGGELSVIQRDATRLTRPSEL